MTTTDLTALLATMTRAAEQLQAAALAQAVSEGRFTQEQVDTMLATMATELLAQLRALERGESEKLHY
ncbi:MAG: hypothetical protein QW808_04365 [Desulfurococcaceae archaeon]